MKLGQTIPALPVRNAAVAVDFYRDRLGFDVLHHDGGFAVLARDESVIHLWEAGDESWRAKLDPEKPVCSGAESFIAGTASCRIQVEGVDELYEELSARDVFHPVSRWQKASGHCPTPVPKNWLMNGSVPPQAVKM